MNFHGLDLKQNMSVGIYVTKTLSTSCIYYLDCEVEVEKHLVIVLNYLIDPLTLGNLHR